MCFNVVCLYYNVYYLEYCYYQQDNVQKTTGLNVRLYYPELFCNNPKQKTYINICMYTCVDFIWCNFFLFKFQKKSLLYF